MPLSISNESKNNLTITNENKPANTTTWADHPETWADTGGSTWERSGTPLAKETKNSLSISNESKN